MARTSMADIAQEAGISRATLYTHFKDKEALSSVLADHVAREALQRMEDAWQPNVAFGENLAAAILAKDLPMHRLKHASPFGGELFVKGSEAVVAAGRKLHAGVDAFLRARALEAATDGRDFEVFGGIAAFGQFAANALLGLKETIVDEAEFRKAIHTFAAMIEASAQKKAKRRA